MNRVFMPQVSLKNGEILSVDGNTYRVMSQGEVVSSGVLLSIYELYERLILAEKFQLKLYYNKDINRYCLSNGRNYFNPTTGNWDRDAFDCWLKKLSLLLKIAQAKIGISNFEYHEI